MVLSVDNSIGRCQFQGPVHISKYEKWGYVNELE